MKNDIFKLTKTNQNKLISFSRPISKNYSEIPIKKIRVDKPWSRWKMNRSSATEYIYHNNITFNPERYNGFESAIQNIKASKSSLIERIRNKMKNDNIYKTKKS